MYRIPVLKGHRFNQLLVVIFSHPLLAKIFHRLICTIMILNYIAILLNTRLFVHYITSKIVENKITKNPGVNSLVEHIYSKYHSDIKNSPAIHHTTQSHVCHLLQEHKAP